MEKVKELVTKCTYNLDIAVKGIEWAYTNLFWRDFFFSQINSVPVLNFT